MRNEIYLRRRRRLLTSDPAPTPGPSPDHRGLGAALSSFLARRAGEQPPAIPEDGPIPLAYIATVAKNFEVLGYTLSPRLVEGLQELTLEQLTGLYEQVYGYLSKAKGADRVYRPMYPNFPKQVMEASLVELYVNALVHYWTDGQYLPASERKARMPLLDNVELIPIDLGDVDDFEQLFGQIIGSNASLSEQDRDDVVWFARTYGDAIANLIPDEVPQKEARAVLGAALLRHTTIGGARVLDMAQTATDVLRLAVALSGGDVSLAENTRFGLRRPERRVLLELLERVPAPAEDMLRHPGAWKRLLHEMHPGEYAKRYPRAYAAAETIRRGTPVPRMSSDVERALADRDVTKAVEVLVARPGDLARRLDHLIRIDLERSAQVIEAFARVADRVSTPVLLQVMKHFETRSLHSPVRVFFPKGDTGRAKVIPNELPELPESIATEVAAAARDALLIRFSALPSMGKVFIDPDLRDCPVPHAGRSSSRGSRQIARGTKLPLALGDTVRFFVWWRDGSERTDLDLSAAFYDAEFGHVADVAYYDLKTFGGHHSGDIVAAPNGASEFIDVDLSQVAARGGRYIAMVVTAYTGQRYADLPECFAGWMLRQQANSGEIYDPRTVVDKVDLTARSRMLMPLLIDVRDRKVIWADLSIRNNPNRVNAVFGNRSTLSFMLQAMLGSSTPTLFDLLSIHVAARGQLVDQEHADAVYSIENGFPFRVEEIASSFMK